MDYRLKKNKDFIKVLNKGERGFSNTLTVVFIKSEALKFGIAVGKKHGGAVKRNRIKRLIREAFREICKSINKNYYLVIIPKVKDEYVLDEFKKDLKYICRKKGIIN